VNIVQSWLIVGVPALVVIGALFTGRSALRAMFGYAALAATLVFFVVVPGDPISAAVIGLVAVFLVATGRGTHVDDEFPEHHENRKRMTTDPSHALPSEAPAQGS
jgi:membrane protein implicated in regulation of membrane protease activity